MPRLALLLLMTLASSTRAAEPPPDKRFDTESPAMVFARVSRSVVLVRVETAQGSSQGSGVIVGKNQVITNLHVVDGAKTVLVSIRGKEVEAKVTATSKRERDLALLSVDTAGGSRAALRRSADLVVGERVFAIGNPRGYEQTLTDGLVSALRKEGDAFVVQTSAAISPGSSGGGLFDARGRLVGITTKQRTDGQNLNFANPVEWVEALLKGKSEGAAAEAPQYSVLSRPAAVLCDIRESARWGLFSEGLELLESTPSTGELGLSKLDTTQPEETNGTRLVLKDLSRKAQVALFTGSRQADDAVFVSFEENGDIRATLAHVEIEAGVPRLVTRSGTCQTLTPEELAARMNKAPAPTETCDTDAAKCFQLASQVEGGERFLYLKKACKLGHAGACDEALTLALEVNDTANVTLLRQLGGTPKSHSSLAAPVKKTEPDKAATPDGKRKPLKAQ